MNLTLLGPQVTSDGSAVDELERGDVGAARSSPGGGNENMGDMGAETSAGKVIPPSPLSLSLPSLSPQQSVCYLL